MSFSQLHPPQKAATITKLRQPVRQKPVTLTTPSKNIMSDILARFKCAHCAVGAVVAGALAYYFIPGANSTTVAMQIAGASFVGQVLGGYVADTYLTDYM